MIPPSHTREEILKLLSVIPDPEIPVISIQELGILRDVHLKGEEVVVDITPTYSGCPAMKAIEQDIVALLHDQGIDQVKVNLVYAPAWTTDWITEAAKEKLRVYGIAPPEKTSVDKASLTGKPKSLVCPHCGSKHVEMVSQFGSTACKALYKCLDCKEPFDYFKCI
ncbi:MAG TPA: 1,2-phenylacetyl-CoA epoxidase subunit PaaD [Bacteroidia bacterium]|jgi:ring-1,2-phenylacetyl-CoA epoxidase subunit PaaD|nr:1,2-phenylacetyl-CoA epoxidase subunit PaaD [Bacteroidia bacterium]